MFAFAIWDERRQALLLARDRIGVKPLFFATTPKGISFASELKAFLTDPDVPKRIHFPSLALYLAWGYVPGPETILEGVRRLPAGHILLAEDGRFRLQQYWDLTSQNGIAGSIPEIAESLADLLRRAVQRRLIADVPIGAFLSGGLDSTTVVGLMAKLTSEPIRTFSIGFADGSYDERKYARLAANSFGTIHRERLVESGIKDRLAEIVWFNDEPLADSSCIPMFFLAELAREDVTVILSGDGGDEAFAGYETYIADVLARYYRGLPAWLRHPVRRVVEGFLPVSSVKVGWDEKLRRFVSAADLEAERSHCAWRAYFGAHDLAGLLRPDVRQGLSVDLFEPFTRFFSRAPGASFLEQSQYVDIKTWLVDDILVKVDRATMAHSLEARGPLLDAEVIQFALRLPSRLRLHGSQTKWILKQAMRGKLPEAILTRRKEGFNAPLSRWLMGELRDLTLDWLSSDRLLRFGLFDPATVDRLLREHFAGDADHGLRIWALLSFVMWQEMFFSGRSPVAVST
jgi:asparagine synthase (glutamine-hydrolysing)